MIADTLSNRRERTKNQFDDLRGGHNRYRAFRSNPVNFVDPMGLTAMATQPATTAPTGPIAMFISGDVVINGELKVTAWLGRTTPFGVLEAFAPAFTVNSVTTYSIQNNQVVKSVTNVSFGAINLDTTTSIGTAYPIDTRPFSSVIPVTIKGNTSFSLKDANGKEVSNLLKAFVEAEFDGTFAAKPDKNGNRCNAIAGKLKVDVEGTGNVQTRNKVDKPWSAKVDVSQPYKSAEVNFSNLDPKRKANEVGSFEASMTKTSGFAPGEYFLLKINESEITYTMTVTGKTYRYEK